MVSVDGTIPSTLTAFTLSFTDASDAYPIAFGFEDTVCTTSPVEVNSCEYTHLSSVPVIDSKPSLVPDAASRPIQTIGESLPPISFQFVILPV